MAEFALIDRFFSNLGATRSDVALSIGDDAALVLPSPGTEIVSVSATLGPESVNTWSDQPGSMGHRLLSTTLNRLSAMGATAAWLTLAITLPTPDETWLEEFCAAVSALARRHDLSLVGGDTTSGPLLTTAVVTGMAPAGTVVSTHGARPGDRILVSGTLGAAALATLSTAHPHRFEPAEREGAARRLAFPTPRVEIAQHLHLFATAAADLSDGLSNGLDRLLKHEDVGVSVDVSRLPVADSLRVIVVEMNLWTHLLNAAGDHEVCVCVPATRVEALCAAGTRIGVNYAEIGVVEAKPGLRLTNQPGGKQ